MAITGTKAPESGSMKNYFVNKVKVTSAEQIDSNYSDCSIKLGLTDISNDYNYTLFINQNFEKDAAGNVSGMKFPDDLNRLFLHTKTDCNVNDEGKVDLSPIMNKDIAVINYVSNGKYKRSCWRCVGSVENTDALEKEFNKSVEKGYPKDFQKTDKKTTNTYAEKLLTESPKLPKFNDDKLPW